MEMLENHISHREARYNSNKHHRRDTKNPSFSSSLLDSIYRSIDEGENHRERDLMFYKQTVAKKKHNTTTNTSRVSSHGVKAEEEEIMSLKRACLIEKWMEIKKVEKVDNVAARRNSTEDFERNYLKYSSSTSSEGSSYGGGFFSSESDSRSMSTSASCYTNKTKTTTKSNRTEDHMRPKPIKTRQDHKPNKQENQFAKTKTKALKIYMDLKKAKQPISPGGKLGSFLTSIFNNGKKKHEVNVIDAELASKSTNGSNCSSVSSFTRSCLRKSSVSIGDIISNGDGDSAKRSVRFYPVSVIVGEDFRPCGHKTLEDDHHRRQVEEIARSYLMKNCKKKSYQLEEMEEEEDDDDAASYASSDLFELDTIGVEEKYYKELPVYETTYLDRNRAIANGSIL